MAVKVGSETSRLASLWSAIPHVGFITQQSKNLWDDIAACYRSSPVQHGAIIRGSPNIGDLILKESIERTGKFNYTSKHYEQENRVFSGIAVTPLSKEMALPMAKIISGGIGSSSVEIEFNSPEGGQWGCNLLICAAEE